MRLRDLQQRFFTRKIGSDLALDQVKKQSASQVATPLGPRLFEVVSQNQGLGIIDAPSVIEALALDVQADVKAIAEENPDALRLMLIQIFGGKTASKTQDLMEAALKGELPLPENVSIVDADVLKGADGAYSPADGGAIFLNANLIKTNPERLEAVFNEEIGHHLDQVLGGRDAPGDEGYLFQRAIQQGQPLSAAELRSGRIDRDHGTIEFEGRKYNVEFSTDAEARLYEAQSSFSDLERKAGAEDHLAQQVDKNLLAQYGTEQIDTIEELKEHFEATGIDYETTRKETEEEVIEQHGGNRDEYLEKTGAWLARRAHVATTLVKLVESEILAEDTKLDTPLPPDIRSQVAPEDRTKITTFEALLKSIIGDTDGDLKADFDAFQLGRYLPKADQQKILRALTAEISAGDLVEGLVRVGFDNAIANSASARNVFTLTPPPAFGLAGDSEVAKTQQQLLLRTGKVFIDSNKNGKIEDSDAVNFMDADGITRQTTFGELTDELKTMVEYNMAVANAIDEYFKKPSHQRVKFPHYNSSTGRAGEERVNDKYWTIGTSQRNRGQTCWSLEDGENAQPPHEAILDVWASGGSYTTECAHWRTVARLKGRVDFYTNRYGKEAGAYGFNVEFAKTPGEKAKANEFFGGFKAYLKESAEGTWEEYKEQQAAAGNAMPEIEYAMEVSRHMVFGGDGVVAQPWTGVEGANAAAGDTGYFHNYSVSVEGVKIGYVGENVIDMGYKNGVRMFGGHPGGIKPEKNWQHELGSRRIKVHNMSEYNQYFSMTYMRHDAERLSDMRVKETKREIEKLQGEEGSEEKIKELEASICWWKALGHVRGTIAEKIDTEKLDQVRSFFKADAPLAKPEDAEKLVGALTAEGQTKLAAAFDMLDEKSKKQVVDHFGAENVEALTETQKAQAAVSLTLTGGGGNTLHPYLREEGLKALTNIEFSDLAKMLESGGKMSNKESFKAWFEDSEAEGFKAWFSEKAGEDYPADRTYEALTSDHFREIIELAFPMTRGVKTIYADVNRGTELLGEQMAELLRKGKLKDAEFLIDSTPVVTT